MSDEQTLRAREEYILNLIKERLEEKLTIVEKVSASQAHEITSFKDEIEELIKISSAIQEKLASRVSPTKKVPDLNLSEGLDDSTPSHQSQTLNGLISPAGAHGRKTLKNIGEVQTGKAHESIGKKSEPKDFGRRKPESKEETKEDKKDDKPKKNMLFDHVNKKDTKKQTKGKESNKPEEKKPEGETVSSTENTQQTADAKDETTAEGSQPSTTERTSQEEEKKEEPEREINDPELKAAVDAVKALSKGDLSTFKSIKTFGAPALVFEALTTLLTEGNPKAKKEEYSTRKLQENPSNLVSLIKNYNFEGVSKETAKKVKDIIKKKEFNIDTLKKSSTALSVFAQWVIAIVRFVLPPAEHPEEEPKTPKGTQTKVDNKPKPADKHEKADKTEKPQDKGKASTADTKKTGKDTQSTKKSDNIPETSNPELQEAYKALHALNKTSIKELVNLPNPANEISGCLRALHLLLSGKEIKEWADLKKHIHVDDVVKKIFELNLNTIDKTRINQVEKMIADEKWTEATMKKKNANIVPFFKFITAAVSSTRTEKITPPESNGTQAEQVKEPTNEVKTSEEVKQEEPKPTAETKQEESQPQVGEKQEEIQKTSEETKEEKKAEEIPKETQADTPVTQEEPKSQETTQQESSEAKSNSELVKELSE